MALQQVLESTEIVSDEFDIPFQSSVTLEGTINGQWTVERAIGYRDDGGARSWSTHREFEQTDNGGIVDGIIGYVFRINLGSGNAGPTGHVARSYTGTYR